MIAFIRNIWEVKLRAMIDWLFYFSTFCFHFWIFFYVQRYKLVKEQIRQSVRIIFFSFIFTYIGFIFTTMILMLWRFIVIKRHNNTTSYYVVVIPRIIMSMVHDFYFHLCVNIRRKYYNHENSEFSFFDSFTFQSFWIRFDFLWEMSVCL